VDVAAIKQRHRWIWAQGDYSVLSEVLRPAARELCDACAVSAGQEGLDVAAGDGNFALACAAEGAKVVASDLSSTMLERGRARAAAEGCEIEWVEADAEDLPFEDGRFDCVGSVFGAVIPPRPKVVASELFRVTRPGGTVGMTAWVPRGFTAELIALGRKYAPPSPDVPASEEWGVEETVRERFGDLAASVDCQQRELVDEVESAALFVRRFSESAPTMAAARQALSPEQFDALVLEAHELAERFNEADDGSVRIRSPYLLTVARKRG
jgi:ubiquinone/menaquinone biosynthesis C-methylase UbiE